MADVKQDLEVNNITEEKPPYQPQPDEDATYIYGPIPASGWIIIITELCERLSFYGASLMFIPYMISVLGYDSRTATAINRAFNFLAYFTVIFGASLADGYLGKFRAILYSAVWYTLGLVLMAATASPAGIHAGAGPAGFLVAIFLFIAFGMGGIKSNVSAFVALQVPQEDIPTGKKPNEYYGYNLTIERVFRFFYWAINIGAVIGQLVCPIIANNTTDANDSALTRGNFGATYAFPAVVFAVGTVVFFMGRSKFKDAAITVNPLAKTFKCVKYALTHRGSNPAAEHWLDNAKVEDKSTVLWDNKFVEDLKKTLRASKVFIFYPFYWALYGNMSDSFIVQGMHMQRPSWLTSEQLNIIDPLVLVILIPIFDYFIFPGIHKMGIKLGPLRRISIGFFLVTLTMALAAIFQSKVYSTGPYFDFSGQHTVGIAAKDVPELQNDFTIWWQILVYFILAVSEIFASATGLEFAFKYASEELKSFVLALFLFTNCIGSLFGMIIAIWSTDPLYTWVFTGEAAVMGVVSIIFTFFFFNKDEE